MMLWSYVDWNGEMRYLLEVTSSGTSHCNDVAFDMSMPYFADFT